MPSGISSGDRKILLLAGVAFIILVALGFLLAPSNTQNEVATTYSTASGGAKAVYLLLQELGYHVERWEHSSTALKPDPHAVLILADPMGIPDEKQKSAVEKFLSGGGCVIATGIVGGMFLPDNSSEFNPMPKDPESEFNALTPSPITRAAPKINLIAMAHWTKGSAIPLYGNREDTVVVHYRRGNGDALWLASATPFTNAGIKQSGNLEFVLAAIGDRQQTRVLFDEYVHGYGERE